VIGGAIDALEPERLWQTDGIWDIVAKQTENSGADAAVQIGVRRPIGKSLGKRGTNRSENEPARKVTIFAGRIAVQIVGKIASASRLEGELFRVDCAGQMRQQHVSPPLDSTAE